MRAPFTYYGGKAGLARRIVELMPEHRVYMEPFFGSGAVLFEKRRVMHEIVNDLDGAVVTFFRCLRDRLPELERACALSPYAREEWARTDLDEAGVDDLEIARRFWVRVNQSFGKTAGSNTGWSATTARTQSTADSTYGRLGRFAECAECAECAERLMHVVIENCDAVGLIERLATADTLIYVDPPYEGISRRGGRGTRPSDYRCDMPETEEHERLAEALHATAATVILSGYLSDTYRELYADWLRIEIAVMVHSSNAVTTARGQRTEVLWSNRPLIDRKQLVMEHA